MRSPRKTGLLFSFLLAAQPLAAAEVKAEPVKVDNPWRHVPVGTVLEFKTSTDEAVSNSREIKHTEATEVWTVVGNDGHVATIEIAIGDAKKRIERDLSPVDPLPQPPEPSPGSSGILTAGGPVGKDRPTYAFEWIETPFGKFAGVRIDHYASTPEAGNRGSEWRAAGFPEPLKAISLQSAGVAVVRTRSETRALVRFEVPLPAPPQAAHAPARPGDDGTSWRDCAIGTNFDLRVEHETRILLPPGQAPAIETSVEHWTLVKKDEQTAVFAVAIGEKKQASYLPVAPALLPAEGRTQDGPEEHRTVSLGRETIETPLGKLECTLIRRELAMNEAGGEQREWRANGYPLAVKTRNQWAHKQQEDIETRTLVRFERGK